MNLFTITILTLPFLSACEKYEATWDSLDKRPIPKWYDEQKFGIFLHWGVFSVPSYYSEWFWYQWRVARNQGILDYLDKYYPKSFTYQEFAKEFTAELFDASAWAELFKKSGAKYVVLTTKHHEGFTLWPSKYSYSWNAADIGPGRDLVGELAEALRAKNLTFGAYHSLFEWFNPMYNADKANNYTTRHYVDNKMIPEVKELVNAYKPSLIWSDGDGGAPDTYWKSTEFLAWLYNESPVKDFVVVNDRWGLHTDCTHGGFYSCADRYNPGTLQTHKWENAMTLDVKSWGFRRNARLDDYYTIEGLILQLVSTVSCGGNLLLNVGPTKDGIITPIYEERLLQIGEWLTTNGDAIYGSRPWRLQRDPSAGDIWYTSKLQGTVVFAIVLNWYDIVSLSVVNLFKTSTVEVTLLGNQQYGPLNWTMTDNSVKITMPPMSKVVSKWAYTLMMRT